jgi:hypothetical protein
MVTDDTGHGARQRARTLATIVVAAVTLAAANACSGEESAEPGSGEESAEPGSGEEAAAQVSEEDDTTSRPTSGVPGDVEGLTTSPFSTTTAHQIRLTWNDASNADTYRVDRTDGEWSTTTTETTIETPGFAACTTFEFEVTPINENGGGPSQIASATTGNFDPTGPEHTLNGFKDRQVANRRFPAVDDADGLDGGHYVVTRVVIPDPAGGSAPLDQTDPPQDVWYSAGSGGPGEAPTAYRDPPDYAGERAWFRWLDDGSYDLAVPAQDGMPNIFISWTYSDRCGSSVSGEIEIDPTT